MALGFKSADQITPQSSSVDQILIAETKWGWGNIGRKDPLSALSAAAKNDIAIRSGSNWIDRGDLITGFSTIATTATIRSGNSFEGSPVANDIHIFSANVDSGLTTYVDESAAALTSAVIGDIAQYDSTNSRWQRRGNLTDLTGISTVASVSVGTAFPLSAVENAVLVFSGAGTSLTGYFQNGITFVPGEAAEGITEEVKSADATDADDANSVDIFYKHQPRIVEGGLREDGTLVDIPIKTGNAGMNRYATGPLDITDGFMVTGACDGSALIYRMITQMKDPGEGEALNATSSSEHTIVTDAAATAAMAIVAIPATITNPVKVKIVPGASSTLIANKASTNVKITGTVIDGLDSKGETFTTLTETVTLTSDQVENATTVETDSYFKTVSAVSAVAADWGTNNNTFAVTCQDNAKQVTFTPQDDELVAFWDIEWTKGTVPNLYRRIIANEVSISVTRTEAIIFALTCLGKDALTYTNFVGNKWTPDSTSSDYPKKSDASELSFASDETYTGWQAALELGGDVIEFPLLDSTLTINQNMVNSDVISGSRFQSSPPVRNGNRDTALTGTVVFTPENNLSNAFRNNLTWNDVKLVLRNAPLAGFPWQTEIVFRKAQLRVSPDPASPRNERINQTFELMAFTEEISGALEYQIIANYADYVRPRVYS